MGTTLIPTTASDFIGTTGSIGAGTTSPRNKLDVSGSVAFGSLPAVALPVANSAYFSGNVGIGTTLPLDTLNVSGSVAFGTMIGKALPVANSAYFSGNVGIGTTNPAYDLDVNGDIRVASGSDLYIGTTAALGNLDYSTNNYVTDSTSFTTAIGALDAAVSGIGSGTAGLWRDETGYIRAANVTDAAGTLFRVYDSGSLSVGRDADPGAGNAYINGTLTVGASSLALSDTNITTSTALDIDLGDNAGANLFAIRDSDDADLFTINSNGVLSLIDATASFTTGSGAVDAFTITNAGTGLTLRINDESADASPFVIDAAGSVGIGTTAPGYTLDVNGDVRIASGSDLYLGTTAVLGDLNFSSNVYVTDSTSYTTTIGALDAAISGVSGNILWNDTGSLIYPDNYTSFGILDTGLVGMGTTNPSARLEIREITGSSTPNLQLSKSGYQNIFNYEVASSTDWHTNIFAAQRARGNLAARTAIQANDYIFNIIVRITDFNI